MKVFTEILLLILVVSHLMSCKDNDEPPATISFLKETSVVSEGAGVAKVSIVLDKEAPGDIVLNFTLMGSAEIGSDFESTGVVSILSGSMEGELIINIVDDDTFEFDPEVIEAFGEKLEITLSAVTGNALLSTEASKITHLLVIEENDQEPYLLIELSWKDKATGDAGDVDMDLVFWYESTPGSNKFQLGPQALQLGTSIGTGFEFLTLSGLTPDTNYGLTFLYFEGTATDLEFTVKFTTFGGGTVLNGLKEAIYIGTYTDANINGDAFQVGDFQIEQTYSKIKYNYPTISDLVIPTSGSRHKQPELIIPEGTLLKKFKAK